MSVNTPLGDALDGFLESLLQRRSAIGYWEARGLGAGVAGSLSGYDAFSKATELQDRVPADVANRLLKIVRYSAWSTGLSALLAVEAFLDADLFSQAIDGERISAVVTGHNVNQMYAHRNWELFARDPDDLDIDSAVAVKKYDSDHAGCVADIIGIHGPVYLVGGACASGNIGLRCALDEIRHHDVDAALVVGPVFDFTPFTLHSLAAIGAISFARYRDEPSRASRPFDADRNGFVVSHGGGGLVLEELEHALRRGARIYSEILGVEVGSTASRTPAPCEEHEARVMERLLHKTGVDPGEIDFVSAHATSTVQGDLAEIRAIKRVFGEHAGRLKINAPKSMLGHTIWSSAVVETVASVLQIRSGRLHPSINIDRLDPEIDLDICANHAIQYPVRFMLNNAFGFAGINSASLICRFAG
jgi:3-oxoacyl-(acyl-carrier-protein) synthase